MQQRQWGLVTRGFVLAGLLGAAMAAPGQAQDKQEVNSPTQLAELLKSSANAPALADRLRQWFGADDIKKGGRAKEQGTTVAFAIEAPSGAQSASIVSQDGTIAVPLTRVGTSDVYAAVSTFKEGQAFRYSYFVDGKAVGNARDLEVYTAPSEFTRGPNVPQGKVTKMEPFRSKVFEATSRDWWVYVPAQAKADVPAGVMVFQDGGNDRNRIVTILDNLIAKGDVPPLVGIFLNPGKFDDGRQNRSVEYDTLSPKYAQFLVEEILPAVDKMQRLRTDANGRGIGGVSSGGICAFTVAWERPDQFSKVVSGVGSFVNLQGGESGIGGGHNYPAMIRNEIGWDKKGKPRPIRVFLSDGANDLDNKAGNWPLANQQMAKALAYGGYDHRFVYGQGFHNDKYYTYLMPDALRYLWRDEVKQP